MATSSSWLLDSTAAIKAFTASPGVINVFCSAAKHNTAETEMNIAQARIILMVFIFSYLFFTFFGAAGLFPPPLERCGAPILARPRLSAERSALGLLAPPNAPPGLDCDRLAGCVAGVGRLI